VGVLRTYGLICAGRAMIDRDGGAARIDGYRAVHIVTRDASEACAGGRSWPRTTTWV